MTEENLFALFLRAGVRVKLRLAACVGLGLATVVATGFFIFQLVRLQGHAVPEYEPPKPKVPEIVAPAFTFTYEMGNLSLPLMSRRNLRSAAAQFTLVLDCPNEESKHAMELHRAKLHDLLIEVASGYYAEDFQSADGFNRFKAALRTELKSYFKQFAPRDVVLRDWLVN